MTAAHDIASDLRVDDAPFVQALAQIAVEAGYRVAATEVADNETIAVLSRPRGVLVVFHFHGQVMHLFVERGVEPQLVLRTVMDFQTGRIIRAMRDAE